MNSCVIWAFLLPAMLWVAKPTFSQSVGNALTPTQQTSIGFSCGNVVPTFTNPITSCNGVAKSKLLTLPQIGQENDDHNVDHAKPRNVFSLGTGTDSLLHVEGPKRLTMSFEIANLANKVALYSFLSTFSGTHFLQPRTAVARAGFTFCTADLTSRYANAEYC